MAIQDQPLTNPMLSQDEWLLKLMDLSYSPPVLDLDSPFQNPCSFIRTLFDTTQDIMVVLNVEARIVLCNAFFENISGYALQEIRGKEWFPLFLPSHEQDRIRAVFQEGLNSTASHTATNPIQTRNGHDCLIEWHNKTLRDCQGNALGILCFGRDITEQKRHFELLNLQRDLALILSRIESLEKSLQRFLYALIQGTCEIDGGCIYLFNQESGDLKAFVHAGLHPDTLNPIAVHSADSPHARHIRKGGAEYVPIEVMQNAYPDLFSDNIRTVGVFSLKFEEESVGGLLLVSRTVAVLPLDLCQLLELISSFVASTIVHSLTVERLRQSEDKHRSIFESSADAILLMNEHGFFDCNQAAVQLFGMENKADFAARYQELFFPDSDLADQTPAVDSRSLIHAAFSAGTNQFKWTQRRKNGETFPSLVNPVGITLNNQAVLQITIRDITQEVEAQTRLNKNVEIQAALNDLISLSLESLFTEEIYSKILFQFTSIPWLETVQSCSLFLVDREAKLLKLRSQRGLGIEQLLRYNQLPLDEALKLPSIQSTQLFIGNPPDAFFEAFRGNPNELLLLLTLKDMQHRLIGMLVLVSSRSHPLDNMEEIFLDSAAQVIVSLLHHKTSEENFKSAYARMDHLINSIPTVLIAIDKNNRVTQWNHVAEKIFGLSLVDVLNQPFSGCPIPWVWNASLKNIPNILHSYKPLVFECVHYTRRDQSDGFMDISITPIRGTIQQFSEFLIVGIDRTEQKLLETHLLQSQKLESIGQLAAGIAHEINTPIQYVGDNIRFLQDSFSNLFSLLEETSKYLVIASQQPLSSGQLQALEKIKQEVDVDYLLEEIPKSVVQSLQGVERVTTIVRAMKGFAHPDNNQDKVQCDLNKGIENTVTVARNEWKYVADLETSLDPALPLVTCLPGEINQVILNLIINASHAIAERLGDHPVTKGKITIVTLQDHGWVEIHVGDTGAGIPPENKNKIFNPFFTTKKTGKGTGQGLAISRSVVVDKHQGSIQFESEVDIGTVFKIRLPIVPPQKELTAA